LGFTTKQAVELLLHPVHSTSYQFGSSASTRGSTMAFAAQGRMDAWPMLSKKRKLFHYPQNLPNTSKGSLMQVIHKKVDSGVIFYWNDSAADDRYTKSNPSLQAVCISFSSLSTLCDGTLFTHV
jgi:UDP-glucose:glycoprotein glucosyltransferase